jgi:7-carboxy-7-deazaguanine synthase
MRLSEVYTSVQGEGPHTGWPIQFVRFGGCNLRCPGWPCDTQFAIDPQYSDEWMQVSPTAVYTEVRDWPKHVCITGGEPLIQRSSEMQKFAEMLLDHHYKIDLFTNGTQALPPWTFDHDVCVMMDWKCPGSGEEVKNSDIRLANAKILSKKDGVKFVVKDDTDLWYAQHITNAYPQIQASLWVGAAWGHISDQEIIAFMEQEKMPWKLNVQVHKHLWSPTLRGV